MEPNDRSAAAALTRSGGRVVGPARKAPRKAEQPTLPNAVTLRAQNDYTPQAKRPESNLDALIFALGLTILVDPYRTFVR